MSVFPTFGRSSEGRASVRRRPRGTTARRATYLATTASALVSVAAAIAAFAPAAQAIGVNSFFAANCNAEHRTCGEGASHPEPAQAKTELFTQAGGYVPYGITDFRVNTEETEGVLYPEGYRPSKGAASVKNVRVDVSPGVVTNPEAVPQCSPEQFAATEVEPVLHIFTPSTCSAESIIGTNRVLLLIPTGIVAHPYADVPLEGNVYNVTPPNGVGLLFGVALSAENVGHAGVYFHTLIEGSVEWATNYHDYFVIKNVTPGLIESRLTFRGNTKEGSVKGSSGFIRNGTSCSQEGPSTTTGLKLESYLGELASGQYTASLGTEQCGLLKFVPTFVLTPETHASDSTDGITAEASVPQRTEEFTEPGTADVKEATVTLPKGMTLNPSAAAGLEACTQKQFGLGAGESRAFEIRPPVAVKCPAGSKLGTVSLEVPTLPPGSLTGSIYLGQAEGPSGEGLTITGPPYTIYLDAQSARYGVQVRTKGTVTVGSEGQLTATISNSPAEGFKNAPEAPFRKLTLHFNGGNYAPIANPLTCGSALSTTSFTPYAQEQSGAELIPHVATPFSEFAVEACASPQFSAPSLSQSTAVTPTTGGSESNLTFTLKRGQGDQYLQQMTTTLPPGVVAKIPSVPLCAEAQANAGTCSAESLIGTVRVAAGSGTPYPFIGRVYLTAPYDGAPYGMSIVVPTAAGPYNFGELVTRAKIEISHVTAQVSVAVVKSFVQGAEVSGLPTIVGGIPIRIQELTLDIDRPNFTLNPTNCGELKTESSLVSTLAATATITSPFGVEGCSALQFKPTFAAQTSAKTSRSKGASLTVNITEHAGQANIKSAVTSLPALLPSRLSTLNHACPEAQAAANILACPASSLVGKVSVVTPTLPGKLTGPVYIVSHAAHAFPDLDLVVQGDGVQVVLIGNTVIKGDVTTTTFAANPDVPISTLALTLPMASNSLLSSNGSFCTVPLYMPTTLTGQNGTVLTQKTRLAVFGCLPITQHRAQGHSAIMGFRVPQRGTVRITGDNLAVVTLHPSKAKLVRVRVPLTGAGVRALNRKHRLEIKVRVAFTPHKRGGVSWASTGKVTFRR